MFEAEQQHLLAMVEAAQRSGRSEREITAIVDRYFGHEGARHLAIVEERGVVRRLLLRASLKRAG
jgi:hypothetical protein